jgi:hypothetical protein
LWTALRALEESASLSQQLAERAQSRGNKRVAERLSDNATLARRRADIIRDALLSEHETATRDEDQIAQTARHVPARSTRQREGTAGHN